MTSLGRVIHHSNAFDSLIILMSHLIDYESWWRHKTISKISWVSLNLMKFLFILMTSPWLILDRLTHENDQWVKRVRMMYDSSRWRHYFLVMAVASIKIKMSCDTKNRLKIWKKIFLTNISKPICLFFESCSKTVFEKNLTTL